MAVGQLARFRGCWSLKDFWEFAEKGFSWVSGLLTHAPLIRVQALVWGGGAPCAWACGHLLAVPAGVAESLNTTRLGVPGLPPVARW